MSSLLLLAAPGLMAVPTPRLAVLPSQVTLVARSSAVPELGGQRLVVERADGGRFTGDVTAKAAFRSSNPRVATVAGDGTVFPVAPGRATIFATVAGLRAATPVLIQTPKHPAPNTQHPTPPPPSFRNQVEPVLTKMGCNSGACHGAAAGKGGMKLTLRGYDPEADHATFTRQVGGRRVSLPEPERSLMLLKPTAQLPHGGGQRFPKGSPEYRLLAAWIKAGAPAPRPNDPRMLRLELFPAEAALKPRDEQQVLVRARFSDGHTEDVTRWVKFGTSDSGVATVSDDGRVALQGPGEAAITVYYLSQVAFARVSSPYPARALRVTGWGLGPASSTPNAQRPTPSFIDALVLKKLRALNLPPSGPCTDAEFIRRAYLDAAGILPTAEEVEAFVNPSRPAALPDSSPLQPPTPNA